MQLFILHSACLLDQTFTPINNPKVKLFVSLLCAILPAKAVFEMIYTVSGGT